MIEVITCAVFLPRLKFDDLSESRPVVSAALLLSLAQSRQASN